MSLTPEEIAHLDAKLTSKEKAHLRCEVMSELERNGVKPKLNREEKAELMCEVKRLLERKGIDANIEANEERCDRPCHFICVACTCMICV